MSSGRYGLVSDKQTGAVVRIYLRNPVPLSSSMVARLQYLDVSSDFFGLSVNDFSWVSRLVSLKHLEMNQVDLSLVNSNWLEAVNMFPDLIELHLATCQFSCSISSLDVVNFTSLAVLDLHFNSFGSMFPNWLLNLSRLEYVDFTYCNLRRRIPLGLGTLPELLDGAETCTSGNAFANFSNLDLSNNQMPGTIPSSLGNAKRLRNIGLSMNKLQGTLPKTFGLLNELVVLDVSFNQLTGILSESHFAQLTKLKIVLLSGNSFTFNLESQKEMNFLDISNASISGSIPPWFWDVSSNLSLLNVSFNQLEGQLPNPLKVAPFADVDFSFNLLSGFVPFPVVEIELLDLSSNHFQGPIPPNISQSMPDLIFLSRSNNKLSGEIPASIGEMSLLQVIDLSMNDLTGKVPNSIGNCAYLKVLDLGNNHLSGTIPDSLGMLNQLLSLHLNDNMFTDELPISFKNMSRLETLDVGTTDYQEVFQPGLCTASWISEYSASD
ncbi:OLC1v1001417C1 [Oldenlandia corymbosa var. corymbosa]|uniref:OLC1v1001417C1 n=1 Tax=Oldenlandia corymbosa var. corymbosa TaxID=529605 RepID=A0AAV1D5Z8_OLDCO|nr:OLC1v1001417C1 [Oldenlandia corymbosa var. corymbosa]